MYVVSAGNYNNSPLPHDADRSLQQYFFDMRSEALPAEAEVVTGAVLRVYKFPAYINMAAASAGHAHPSQLVLHVSDDVTTDWLVSVLSHEIHE